MISRFFIANSTYSLLQYSLAFTDKMDKTFFLLGPAIKDCNLKSKASIKLPPKELLDEYVHSFLDKLESKLEGSAMPFYGNLVTPYANEISQNYPFYSLSDGASDSHMVEKHLNNPNIIQCYTTKLGHEIEKSAHPKLVVHDLEKLWNEKNAEEKAKIASIFNVDEKSLKLLETKSVILITQPLSEDGIVSEEDKVKLYKSILKNYDINQVVIKPHPREKTNWAEIFPGTPIITRQVPAELLSMMVKPQKVCTFYSTAAFPFALLKMLIFILKTSVIWSLHIRVKTWEMFLMLILKKFMDIARLIGKKFHINPFINKKKEVNKTYRFIEQKKGAYIKTPFLVFFMKFISFHSIL